jgi:hypothetical protein
MSLFSLERPHLFGIEPPEEDAITEYIDYGLECSNAKRAENLATRIREEIGIYRFGPMWADWFGKLPDGRTLWLQASDESLIINIIPTDDSWEPSVHAGWNRKDLSVYSLDERDPDKGKPQMSYQKYIPGKYEPESLTPWHISHEFAGILGRAEKTVEKPHGEIILSHPETR